MRTRSQPVPIGTQLIESSPIVDSNAALVKQGEKLFAASLASAQATARRHGRPLKYAPVTAAGSALVAKATADSSPSVGSVLATVTSDVSTAVSDVMTIVEDEAIGESIGSIIPVFGTVVGAVIGALIGVVSDIEDFFVKKEQPAQGEFRSTAERKVFPSRPMPKQGDPPVAPKDPIHEAQQLIMPAVWGTYRSHAVGFQPVDTTTHGDPGPGQSTIESNFTVAVGWVSPPRSTVRSTRQAWLLTQLFIYHDTVSQAAFQAAPADKRATMAAYGKWLQNATTIAFGDKYKPDTALKLLRSMVASNFGTATSQHLTQPIATWPDAKVVSNQALVGMANSLNEMYPSDYIYYVFSGAVMKQASDATNYITPLTEGKRGDSTDTSTWMSAILGDTANRYSLFLVPDTTICGIAELCCLAATGALPIDGIYLIAFHYVMGHCWLWHTGQIKDGKPGLMAHPNFSRLLAILSQRVASQTAARVLQMSKSAVKATVAGEVDYGTDLHTNDVGAIMKAADAADNAVPWTPLLLTAGGLFLGYFLLKRWGRPENEDRDEALDELWVAAMRTSTRSYR